MQLQASRYSAYFYYKKLAGNMVMCWLYLFSRFPQCLLPGSVIIIVFFFLIIKKWKSERPNLGFGGSKIGMSCQNRDTWQIWARIPVIFISILVNIVLSDFYIGLAQFRRPYVPFFRSFSYKNAGFKSKKK